MEIPHLLLEGSTGATAFALAWVFGFQLLFLGAAFYKIKSPMSFYRQMKPVIALTMAFGGFLLQFVRVWARGYAESHARALMGPDTAIALHIVGTACAIIGVLCWLRVTMPHFCGSLTWAAIALLAAWVFILPALV